MFYYLSFLRPPPRVVRSGDTLLIALQISNDLRTEIYEGQFDLYFSWTVYPPKNSVLASHVTSPKKLTTWRTNSTYKEIPITVPSGVRHVQEAQLTISISAISIPEAINLTAEDIGKNPFTVSTPRIIINGNGDPRWNLNSGKLEMIERKYSLAAAVEYNQLILTQAQITLSESTSFALDKKVWDSGIGLAAFISRYYELRASQDTTRPLAALKRILFSQTPINVVELGTGIGIASMSFAAARSAVRHGMMQNIPDIGPDNIYSTDVESALPILEGNINNNDHAYTKCKPQPLTLDWDDDDLPEPIKNLGTIDLILMADVCYNTGSFPALTKTLSKLIALDREHSAGITTPTRKGPLILLGYKERDPAERTFWDITKELGIKFTKSNEKKGAGGQPVEIWIGEIERVEQASN